MMIIMNYVIKWCFEDERCFIDVMMYCINMMHWRCFDDEHVYYVDMHCEDNYMMMCVFEVCDVMTWRMFYNEYDELTML